MKNFLLASSIAGLMATSVMAGTVSYNTTGSTLSCNGVAGCVQNTPTAVTVGGLTVTYNTGSGSNVVTPSIINLGSLVQTGTGSNVNLTGLRLIISVTSTPPGASGFLPNGNISGTLSTSQSGASITFSPNNTTTGFGTLPGVVIGGGLSSFTYQVLNPTLGLTSPTDADSTSIQGAVTDSSSPEPTTVLLMGAGIGAIAVLRRRSIR